MDDKMERFKARVRDNGIATAQTSDSRVFAFSAAKLRELLAIAEADEDQIATIQIYPEPVAQA